LLAWLCSKARPSIWRNMWPMATFSFKEWLSDGFHAGRLTPQVKANHLK
jgi:hypothetical protein